MKMFTEEEVRSILQYAEDHNCGIKAASLLGILDNLPLFARPKGQAKEADECHEQFKVEGNDILTYFKAYEAWSTSTDPDFAYKHFLKYDSLVKAQQTANYLLSEFDCTTVGGDYPTILPRALLTVTKDRIYLVNGVTGKYFKNIITDKTGKLHNSSYVTPGIRCICSLEYQVIPSGTLGTSADLPDLYLVRHNFVVTPQDLQAVDPENCLECPEFGSDRYDPKEDAVMRLSNLYYKEHFIDKVGFQKAPSALSSNRTFVSYLVNTPKVHPSECPYFSKVNSETVDTLGRSIGNYDLFKLLFSFYSTTLEGTSSIQEIRSKIKTGELSNQPLLTIEEINEIIPEIEVPSAHFNLKASKKSKVPYQLVSGKNCVLMVKGTYSPEKSGNYHYVINSTLAETSSSIVHGVTLIPSRKDLLSEEVI